MFDDIKDILFNGGIIKKVLIQTRIMDRFTHGEIILENGDTMCYTFNANHVDGIVLYCITFLLYKDSKDEQFILNIFDQIDQYIKLKEQNQSTDIRFIDEYIQPLVENILRVNTSFAVGENDYYSIYFNGTVHPQQDDENSQLDLCEYYGLFYGYSISNGIVKKTSGIVDLEMIYEKIMII